MKRASQLVGWRVRDWPFGPRGAASRPRRDHGLRKGWLAPSLRWIHRGKLTVTCRQSGNEALASIPAKAYEYIGLCKPVLAIGAGQEVCEVMRRGGCPVWSVPANDPDAIAAAIGEIQRFLSGTAERTVPTSGHCEQLTRARMGEEIEKVMQDSL